MKNRAFRYFLLAGVLVLTMLWILIDRTPESDTQEKQATRRGKDTPMNAYKFHFTDKLMESGIQFRHQATKDSRENFKMIHYTHGNGLLVADVDDDGLLDVYFLNQIGSNALYKNLGNGRFEDITETSATGIADRVSVGGSFADIDNDGDQDLFIATVRTGNVLLENLGNGLFRNITKKAGLGYKGHSSSSIFFDFDNDGFLDLYLLNVGRYTTDQFDPSGYYVGYPDMMTSSKDTESSSENILYRNLGNNRFKIANKEMELSLSGWNGDGIVVDYNNDNFHDLYIADFMGDDHFLKNEQGRGFREVTGDVFEKTSGGTMGLKFFDFNNDLFIDLMTTDMHSDMKSFFTPEQEKLKLLAVTRKRLPIDAFNNILGNAFFKNLGEGVFVEISDDIGVETYWPWGISVGDVNADGYQDVFVSSGMGYNYRYGKNVLLMNQGGKRFKNAELELQIEPRSNGNIIDDYFSLNCANEAMDRPECKDDYNKQQDCVTKGMCYKNGYVTASRSSRASAIFDIDNDGDLDIITNDFNAFPQVFISKLADQNDINYLKIKLIGTTSNRNAIGAKVTIFYGEQRQVRYIDAKSGYLSQSHIPLYFGLGEAKLVDKILIQWPTGIEETFTKDIKSNTLLLFTESGNLSSKSRANHFVSLIYPQSDPWNCCLSTRSNPRPSNLGQLTDE